MGVSINEQETVIQFSRNSDKANIWTSDTTVMTKLDKYCEKNNSPYKCRNIGRSKDVYNEILSKTYETNKKLISFRSQQTKRELTDEQKEQLSQRMKQLKSKEKGDQNDENDKLY